MLWDVFMVLEDCFEATQQQIYRHMVDLFVALFALIMIY